MPKATMYIDFLELIFKSLFNSTLSIPLSNVLWFHKSMHFEYLSHAVLCYLLLSFCILTEHHNDSRKQVSSGLLIS